MRLRVLGSGSQGNCLAVRSAAGTLVLVDCGLSCREIERRAYACGFDPGDAEAVLFTHDHSDHISGLATYHKHNPAAALFANGETAEAITARTGVDEGWFVFDNDEPFNVQGFRITPFALSHDAANPVGFLIEDTSTPPKESFASSTDSAALFIATDTGRVTEPMRRAFASADCAILESNYDPVLLETSDRAWSLKRRISSDSGHLSNEEAADFLRSANPMRLKTLILAHISRQCNAPDIALSCMKESLVECGRSDVALSAVAQDEPSTLFEF